MVRSISLPISLHVSLPYSLPITATLIALVAGCGPELRRCNTDDECFRGEACSEGMCQLESPHGTPLTDDAPPTQSAPPPPDEAPPDEAPPDEAPPDEAPPDAPPEEEPPVDDGVFDGPLLWDIEPGVAVEALDVPLACEAFVDVDDVAPEICDVTIDRREEVVGDQLLAVYDVTSLNVAGELVFFGGASHGVVVLVHGAADITGLIDVGAFGDESGAGARRREECGAQLGVDGTGQAGSGGGALGGFGGFGGDSGVDDTEGLPGGEALLDPFVVPAGGCHGGGGDGRAGGGGGFLYIAATGALTGDGLLGAAGGGARGDKTVNESGGAGGGSGGLIVLDAAPMTYAGHVDVRGGGGGGGAFSNAGGDGLDGLDGGEGGAGDPGTNNGGSGGSSLQADGLFGGTAGDNSSGGGGGGGTGAILLRGDADCALAATSFDLPIGCR